MTMNYLLKKDNRSERVRAHIIRAVVFALGCVFIGFFFHSSLSSAVFFTLKSTIALRVYEEHARAYVGSIFLSKYALSEQLKALQIENAHLREEVTSVSREEALIGLWGTSSVSTITPARVVLRPPYGPYDTLTLDRGSNAGITIGARVYPVGRMVPIGTIGDVSTNSALANLFSAAGQTLAITVGTSTEEWTAEGRGGGMFEVRFPRSKVVTMGDEIIARHESSLPFSVVSEIISHESDPFQVVRFLLPVSFSELDIVGIRIHS